MLDSMFEPGDPAQLDIDDLLALFPALSDPLTSQNTSLDEQANTNVPAIPRKPKKQKRKRTHVIKKSAETAPIDLAQLCNAMDQEIAAITIKHDQAVDKKERNRHSARISRLQVKKKLLIKDQTISFLTNENKTKDDEILKLQAQVKAYEFLLSTMRADLDKLQFDFSQNSTIPVVFQYSPKQSLPLFDELPTPRPHTFIEPAKLG